MTDRNNGAETRSQTEGKFKIRFTALLKPAIYAIAFSCLYSLAFLWISGLLENQLEKDRRRFEELDILIQNLYEANVKGKISDRRFRMLSDKYEQEQEELEAAISETENQIREAEAATSAPDDFLKLARSCTDFSVLTAPMLNQFVEKILVHEGEKIDGERTQEIEIYLKFIGKVEIPQPELSEEELQEEERLKARRAKGREKARRYRERQKQKKLEAS